MAAAAYPSIGNLVHELSTSTGSGNLTTTSVNGKQTLNIAFGNGATTDVFYYFVSNRDVAGELEWGTGHLSAATTLVRDTVLGGSNGTSAVNFSAGTKDIVCDIPALRQRIFQGGMGVPGGRLTLASATPIMTTTQSGKTVIYYAFYVGDQIPIYDGVQWQWLPFTELSNDTTQSSTGKAGPAAVTTNSNYDLFVWNNTGVLTLTRGPLWTSDTGRGTGAGTTELQRINGLWTNKIAITNGPGANLGTYVGTVRSDGSSQINYIFGALAASGTAGNFSVWNMYHRVQIATFVADNTNNWTYGTNNTYRAANASATMRVSMIRGLDEDRVVASYSTIAASDLATRNSFAAVGVDSTTVFSGTVGLTGFSAAALAIVGMYGGLPGLGFHYIQALEANDAGTSTFYGDNGGTMFQSGFRVELTG